MARISGYSSKNNYGFFIDVWDTEVSDGATNTSKVGFNLYVVNNGTRWSGSNYVVNVTINGTNYGRTQSIDTTDVAKSGGEHLVINGTTNAITHNTDGSKTVSVFASISRSSYSSYDGGYMELSGDFTLQKISRYFSQTPVLTYNSATETTMNFSWSTSETCSKAILYRDGTAIQTKSSLNATSGSFDAVTGLTENTSYQWYVKCTRKDSGMDSNSTTQAKTTYAYPYISKVGTTEITIPAPGGSVSQVLTLYNPLSRSVSVSAKVGSTSIATAVTTTKTSATLSLAANSMYTGIGSSATTGTVTYTCTYSSVNKTATGTCKTIADNCGPTVSANPTYTNTSGTTHTDLVGTDTIIQGKSSFRVTAPAITTRGSATVAKYYFKIGNGSYENAGTTNYKNYTSTSLSGSVIAYCYAEDSRGYTSVVKQVTMRVLAYSAPTATITATRTGYTKDGSITINATRSTLSKSNATGTDTNKWVGNTSSNKISYAITPNSANPNSGVIGGTGTSSSGTVSISAMDLNTTYTITVNISDKISTVTKTVTISKANPILAILNTNRVGVNKPDPGYTLDVNGTTNISGNTSIGGTLSLSLGKKSIDSQNKANYPWHRVAHITIGTGSYNDKDVILDLKHNYNGGGYGRFKISTRTNSSGTACNVSINRLYGYNLKASKVAIGIWGTTGQDVYADVYFKVGTYARASVIQPIAGDLQSNITLIASNEVSDTTTTDKKTSVECYTSVENAATLLYNKAYTTISYGVDYDIDTIYPVGSIYLSVTDDTAEKVQNRFGGTWVAFAAGRTLIGVGSNGTTNYSTVNATGGAETNSYTPAGTINNHTLTVNELPNVTGDAWANFVCHQDGSTSNGVLSYEYGGKSGSLGGGNTMPFGHIKINFGSGWGHNHGWTGTAANISTVQPYVTVYMWRRTA